MDAEMIKYLAGAARIELTGQEISDFNIEIDELINYLNAVNDAPPNDHFDIVSTPGALRDDVPREDGTADEMLGAMRTYDGFVKGPRII